MPPLTFPILCAAWLVLGCGPDAGRVTDIPEAPGLPVPDLAPLASYRFTFEDMAVGGPVRGFSMRHTGKAGVDDWAVERDGNNQVVAQRARNRGMHFNLLTHDSISASDVVLSVRVKAIDGEEDQGGGVIWRMLDADNYYIARFNPLEDNLRLYRVVKGDREQLASVGVSVVAGSWWTLEVRMKGDRIECAIDGRTLIETDDATFSMPGHVGLWTKADARTWFDDLSVEVLR
ncbi:MAG: hypothetical protein IPJ87_00995 [Flavobacteriales bacterium]|nr:hypothetical protein [Flavobacteriales bacterium]MBK7940452.1 hypothetical protein [Flavobacteriales bacterium]MBK9699389.1 hypothetical protein [Flavobacteriales bacterium]